MSSVATVVSVNINTQVRIKLLPRGIEQHRRHFYALGLDPATYRTPPDADGYERYSLWEIMHVFGPACYMGPEPPFETTMLFELPA